MLKVTIIGTGNVAWHFAQAVVSNSKLTLTAVVGRNKQPAPGFESYPYFSSLPETLETDVYMLCIADDALQEVADTLKNRKALVLHTSGSMPISVLESLESYGVFYPLQSLSKGRLVDFNQIPFLVEANDKNDLNIIKRLGNYLNVNMQECNSAKRAHLHFAAVMSSNFSNHLLYLTQRYCNQEDLDFNLLKPLLSETIEKSFDLGAFNAQTGPAQRGDVKLVEQQKNLIEDKTLQKIYTLFSNSILKTYGTKKL